MSAPSQDHTAAFFEEHLAVSFPFSVASLPPPRTIMLLEALEGCGTCSAIAPGCSCAQLEDGQALCTGRVKTLSRYWPWTCLGSHPVVTPFLGLRWQLEGVY